MANFVDEARARKKAEFEKKRDAATGEGPKALPGKAPQIAPDRGPTAASHKAARAVLKRRRAAEHEDFNTSLVPKAKKGAAPKAKVEPEFIIRRLKRGSIKIRNPKFKRK